MASNLKIGGGVALVLVVLAVVALVTWLVFRTDTYDDNEASRCGTLCKRRGYCAVGNKSWNEGRCCRESWSAPAGCTDAP